ncbi:MULTISPECIES: 1,4-alpha-glucan branching protein [unclassified Streptomyces]|uniref:maltokinase N-terminal cap-like domain-containing protein n=1 Tax=unclassified Streptomyces TaxID=2593676 RepID=UPI0035DE6443
MAVIHKTTMEPTKLELLAAWLPTRAWYAVPEGGADPAKAGGFRLDDPAGEVGIEFMVVTEGDGPDAAAYLVPMTYRGAPLEGAEDALIGTSEHGVLGTRWIYDGTHDPVLVAELYALLTGRAKAQHQSVDDTVDTTVTVTPVLAAEAAELANAADTTDATTVTLRTSTTPERLTLRRTLTAGEPTGGRGGVTAEWQLPGGGTARGTFVVVDEAV